MAEKFERKHNVRTKNGKTDYAPEEWTDRQLEKLGLERIPAPEPPNVVKSTVSKQATIDIDVENGVKEEKKKPVRKPGRPAKQTENK